MKFVLGKDPGRVLIIRLDLDNPFKQGRALV